MDRKSIAIVAVCFILILGWNPLMNKFYPTPPPSAGTATNVVATASNSAAPAGTVAMVAAPVTPAATMPAGKLAALTNAPEEFMSGPEELLVVSNENARYTFTSRGGGLKKVELLKYAETVSRRREIHRTTNELATLNDAPVPPVFAIMGEASLQGDGAFKLKSIPNGVEATKTLPNGLAIVKDFQVGENYLLRASVRFENHAQSELSVPSQQWQAGASTPMGPQDTGYAETVLWYNGAKAIAVATPYFNTNTTKFLGMFPRTPSTEYLEGANNVGWVSSQNQFFTLALIPAHAASAVMVHLLEFPTPTAEELEDVAGANKFPKGLSSALIYPGFKLAPGQVVTNEFTLFAGPKKYETLASLAAQFKNDIDLVMNFGWMSPVSKTLLITMNWFHNSLKMNYGIVILLITVLIKIVFWPLTQASLRSSKKMQALQPQLKALQAKYKDEPQKFTAKQWELYKKNKVNPMSGCLPALLQIPVFIGFYGMLRTAIELRGAQFLWMGDLSKPDTVFSLPVPLHFLGYPNLFVPINPMPLIMLVTLMWQASTTPPSPGMDPSQQKMMKYMPAFMLLFMYSQPSGLALYWTMSNLMTITQTKLTKVQPVTVTPSAAAVAPKKKINN